MRFALFACSLGSLVAVACATPTTVVVGPTCAKLTVVGDDKAKDAGGNALAFDHSFDLPLRKRIVRVEYPDGTSREVVLTSDHQDSARVVAGCAFGACGGYELLVAALSPSGSFAQLGSLVGGGSLLAGSVLEVVNGWRPDQATEEILDEHGVCDAKPPATPVAPVPPAPPAAPAVPSENSPSPP